MNHSKRRAWNETRQDGDYPCIELAATSPSPISAQQCSTLISLYGWFRMSLLTVYHSHTAPPGAVECAGTGTCQEVGSKLILDSSWLPTQRCEPKSTMVMYSTSLVVYLLSGDMTEALKHFTNVGSLSWNDWPVISANASILNWQAERLHSDAISGSTHHLKNTVTLMTSNLDRAMQNRLENPTCPEENCTRWLSASHVLWSLRLLTQVLKEQVIIKLL